MSGSNQYRLTQQPATSARYTTDATKESTDDTIPAGDIDLEIVHFAQNRQMEPGGQHPPTRDKLVAAAALLDQKRQAAASYQESRRSQMGNSGNKTLRSATTGGEANQAAAQGNHEGHNPLSEVLGALGDTPGDRDGNTTTGTNQPAPPSTTQTSHREKDQEFLLQAARQAMEPALFPEPLRTDQSKAHPGASQLAKDNPASETTQAHQDATPAQTPSGAIIQKEEGVSFIIGAVPTHTYCGLPSFYDKNVKAMKGSIPLTIFDPIWQKQAAAHHAERRTVDRANTNNQRYTGLPTPGKWTQSYVQWSRNYQSFISALKNVYKFLTFSEWFRIHKEYNLAVRVNAFQCNLFKSDTLIFGDVSRDRPEIAMETSAKAKQYEETSYIDNPYLPGGKRENYNPYTGLEKTSAGAGKAAQESKARGANFQGIQGKGQWEPYNAGGQREEDSYCGQGNRSNAEGSGSRDLQDNCNIFVSLLDHCKTFHPPGHLALSSFGSPISHPPLPTSDKPTRDIG
ncbi:hypothetical protein PCASD_04893 [Puccinia coronata f. sp. avenae]|nr:hypothetical protein PCASD_04893 [Puccinia coronata f. sp. avenae]